jgi:hypothetical protein
VRLATHAPWGRARCGRANRHPFNQPPSHSPATAPIATFPTLFIYLRYPFAPPLLSALTQLTLFTFQICLTSTQNNTINNQNVRRSRSIPLHPLHPLPSCRRLVTLRTTLSYITLTVSTTNKTTAPVWIKRGICSADSFINIALCCLGWLPGLLHAWVSSTSHDPSHSLNSLNSSRHPPLHPHISASPPQQTHPPPQN